MIIEETGQENDRWNGPVGLQRVEEGAGAPVGGETSINRSRGGDNEGDRLKKGCKPTCFRGYQYTSGQVVMAQAVVMVLKR